LIETTDRLFDSTIARLTDKLAGQFYFRLTGKTVAQFSPVNIMPIVISPLLHLFLLPRTTNDQQTIRAGEGFFPLAS
jgi:hypothetical protein